MDRKKLLKALNYVFFIGAGIFLFYLVYKDLDLPDFLAELKTVHVGWILVSFMIGLFSHVSRAYRWNMLIHPLGFRPRVINSFLSVMVMYLANLVVPRIGEIVRCSLLTKYEKVPFPKLIGTVIVERLTDAFALFVFAFMIVASQFKAIKQFFQTNPELSENFTNLFSVRNLLVLLVGFVALIVAAIIFRQALKKTSLYKKIIDFLKNIVIGFKTIMKLKNPWLYIGHTVFIYAMWLLSLYAIFLSYPPTKHLGFGVASVALVMGALAMIAPVMAGLGAWHYMVSRTLVMYGVAVAVGEKFALIAHTSTFYIFLMIFGALSFIALPFVNKNNTSSGDENSPDEKVSGNGTDVLG